MVSLATNNNGFQEPADSLKRVVEKISFAQNTYHKIDQELIDGSFKVSYWFTPSFELVRSQVKQIVALDTVFANYIHWDSNNNLQLFGISKDSVTQQGIVPIFQADSLISYQLYENKKLLHEYQIRENNNFQSWLSELVRKSYLEEIDGTVYKDILVEKDPIIVDLLQVDSLKTPDYGGQEQTLEHDYEIQEDFFSDSIDSSIEYVVFKSSKAQMDQWLVVTKKSSLIWIYELVSDPQTQEVLSFKNARINNLGFEQKRVMSYFEDKMYLWNVYFEPTRNIKWDKPNQFLFNYTRRSDRKPITGRVVVDQADQTNGDFFYLVLSLAQNPELFKITTSLKDLDFQNFNPTKNIGMQPEFKTSYTVDTSK